MSALLLARAARVLGWPSERWGRGWPDLLTAHEIATLESCDDTGKPDPGKRAAVLALLETMGPDADGQAPAPIPMVGYARIIGDALNGVTTNETPCYFAPAYRAETYRQWAARDWPPGAMVAAWMGQDEAAAVPQDEPRAETAQRNHTEARAGELAAVLDAIEARAVECGWPLVRTNWPGTKAEFRAFLKWYASGLAYSLPADDGNLSDNLRPHGVTFGKPGRSRDKGQKMYQALFPDYPA